VDIQAITRHLPGRAWVRDPRTGEREAHHADRSHGSSVAADVCDVRTLASSWHISLQAANLSDNTIATTPILLSRSLVISLPTGCRRRWGPSPGSTSTHGSLTSQ
jgi:hypothetical protein